ncbi:type II toxin-antitoxin system VapC family toxin [Microseira wollei]|uniref:PIN domain-containing protein n=1 Tax=Microseira wollei NIES-4236 TaxID=2530354 RepID=A0AAV3X9G6_9CYAN|nr:type II toxin-antitoxin system VapC family toxin [Microseira wollei]GET39467.1 hypothetical protein MiSe_42360 [Microseira wollei NIES-4236]
MRFLLDTNICIYIIKQKPPLVLEKFRTLEPSEVGISSITVAELEYGVYKSQRQEQNRAALSQFLSGACQVCKFTPTPAHGAAIQTKPARAG